MQSIRKCVKRQYKDIILSCLHDNLEATGWRVFAIPEKVNQQSGKECCCCGSYLFSLLKRWLIATVVSHVQYNIYIIVSMFLSHPPPSPPPHCTLNIFATEKHGNHGGKYVLEIPANFHFYAPEKTIKLAKR